MPISKESFFLEQGEFDETCKKFQGNG